MGLLLKSRLEGDKSRTVERSALQLNVCPSFCTPFRPQSISLKYSPFLRPWLSNLMTLSPQPLKELPSSIPSCSLQSGKCSESLVTDLPPLEPTAAPSRFTRGGSSGKAPLPAICQWTRRSRQRRLSESSSKLGRPRSSGVCWATLRVTRQTTRGPGRSPDTGLPAPCGLSEATISRETRFPLLASSIQKRSLEMNCLGNLDSSKRRPSASRRA